VTVTWPLGDPRYRVRTVATGGGIAADGFLSRRRLSVWGAVQPASLVAAITPDFGSYTPRRSIPSGLEIGARTIVHLPGSTVPPSVGYTREGRLVIGSVRAKPIGFQLHGGATATVDAVNGLPSTPSGVGAYTRAGAA